MTIVDLHEILVVSLEPFSSSSVYFSDFVIDQLNLFFELLYPIFLSLLGQYLIFYDFFFVLLDFFDFVVEVLGSI